MEKDKKPFNDVMEHMRKIEGAPDHFDFSKSPKPIRIIGYFIVGFLALTIVLMVIGGIMN